MAFYSGFFNSVNGDRKYNALDFSRYLEGLITNGCFPNDIGLKVVASGMAMPPKVVILPGKAYLDGLWFLNDLNYTLDLPAQVDPGQKHLIYLCFDINSGVRNVTIKYVTGQSPVIPASGNGQFNMPLALVSDQQSSQIIEANIQDRRWYAGVSGVGINTPSIVDGAITAPKIADTAVHFNHFGDDIFRAGLSYNWPIASSEVHVTDIFNTNYSWTAGCPRLTGLASDRDAVLMTMGCLTVSHSEAGPSIRPKIGCGLWNSTDADESGADLDFPGFIMHLPAQSRGHESADHVYSLPFVFTVQLTAGDPPKNLLIGFSSNASGFVNLQASRSTVSSFILPR